jgi:HSP20 family molecular chaperone IbpA
MHTLRPLIFSSLLAAPHARADLLSHMMESIKEMENHIKHMQDTMRSRQGLISPSTISYDISDGDETVELLFKGIKTDKELNAVMDDTGNQLTIQTPQGSINLRAKDRLLVIEIRQKEEIKQDNKGQASAAISISNSSSSQLLAHKITLDDVSIDYDQTTHELKVSIPKNLGKRIPIKVR